MKTVVFDNGVDIEGIKKVFNIWIDNFKKSVLDEEFKQDSDSRLLTYFRWTCDKIRSE